MSKSTISIATFNSHVNIYQRVGVWTIGVQPDRPDRVGPLQQLLGKAKDTSLWTWLQPQPQPRPKRLRHPRAWLSKPLVALTLHNTCLDEEQQQAAQHMLQSPGCVHAIWSPRGGGKSFILATLVQVVERLDDLDSDEKINLVGPSTLQLCLSMLNGCRCSSSNSFGVSTGRRWKSSGRWRSSSWHPTWHV